MSKQISPLAIKVHGDVNPLGQAFARADGMMGRFVGNLGSLGRKAIAFTGIASAVSILTSGAGIGALVHHELEAIDATSKLAARLQVGTESLVGFEHAANLAGLSSEQLAGGLGFLMKNLGKAAEGADETGGAFGQLGLNVNELMRMSPDEVFMRVADAIAEVPNPMRRAYMATQIFGKSGQQLLPLLMQGSKGLREATKEAKALGLAFSKVDGERIEEANDSITRFKMTFVGIGRTFAVAIAPVLDQLADKFTAWGIKAVATVKEVTPEIMDHFGSFVSSIGTAGGSLFDWVKRNREAIAVGLKFAGMLALLRYGIPLLSSAILAGNNALGSFTKFLGAGSSGLKGMADQFFGARMRVGTFKATLETLGPSLKSLGRTGLLGAAVLTVAAFSAVLVRNITHQESWRESAFRTARSAGLFKDAVTEFGVAMEDMGATARGIMEVEEKLRNASTIETKIRLQQELNELLHQQLLRMQQIDKLEGTQSTNTPWWAQLAGGAMMAQGNASGGVMMDAMFGDPVTLDAGINDKRLDAFDKKIAEGEKRLEALRAARDKQTGTGGEFDFGENPLGPTAAAPIEPETPAIIERTKEAMEELASGQLVGVEAGTLFRQTFETLKASLASGEINAIQFNEAWKQLTDGLAAGEAKIASDALEKFNSTMLDIEDQIFALNNSEIDVKVREFARTDGITDEQVDQYRKGLEKLETAKAKFNQDDTGLDAFAASLDTGPSLLEAGSAEAEHFRARLAVADQQMQSIAPAPQTAVASAAPVAEQDTAQLTSEIKTALTGPKSERAIQEKALKVATDSLAVLKKLAERDDGPIQVISF